MQTHSVNKQFECSKCHKTFALKSYLNKHLESSCFRDDTVKKSGEVNKLRRNEFGDSTFDVSMDDDTIDVTGNHSTDDFCDDDDNDIDDDNGEETDEDINIDT